jgi:hypothetical protein
MCHRPGRAANTASARDPVTARGARAHGAVDIRSRATSTSAPASATHLVALLTFEAERQPLSQAAQPFPG